MMELSSFLKEIQKAERYDELFSLHQKMPQLIQQSRLLKHKSSSFICHQISRWHDQLMRRVIELAKKEFVQQTGQSLPCFNWVLFGSSAREETTFWTDQDNGLIYLYPEHSDPHEVDQKFELLSQMIVHGLHQAGYPLCEGKVMANYLPWRSSLEEWLQKISIWVEHPTLENIRSIMIAADMRSIYGEPQLFYRVRQKLFQEMNFSPSTINKCWSFIDHQSFPLGFFGNWLKERHGVFAGTIQLKRSGYQQLVGMLRLFSMHKGIVVASSRKRIAGLAQVDPFFAHYQSEIQKSLDTFLSIRLSHHIRIGNIRKQPEDFIHLDELSKYQQVEWKEAILWVKKLKRVWREKYLVGEYE